MVKRKTRKKSGRKKRTRRFRKKGGGRKRRRRTRRFSLKGGAPTQQQLDAEHKARMDRINKYSETSKGWATNKHNKDATTRLNQGLAAAQRGINTYAPWERARMQNMGLVPQSKIPNKYHAQHYVHHDLLPRHLRRSLPSPKDPKHPKPGEAGYVEDLRAQLAKAGL